MDEPTSTTAPTSPTETDRHHRVRTVLLVAGAVLLLGAAFVVGSFIFRDQPTERSVDDAVDAFRSSSTAVEPNSFAQPDAGVYEAVGTGGEAISAPPMEQIDSRTMPVTVTPSTDGCWTWRIDYNSAHWHEYDFCPEGTGLILEGQRNSQSWDLGVDTITNLSTTTCDPPAAILVAGAEPGDAVQHRCAGVNTAAPGDSLAAGPSTMVGRETLVIGGDEVDAVHQRRETTMTGAQRGTIDEDWWLDPTTGLPLRVDRDYDLRTDSVIGEIGYTETGSWQLTSLEPRS
jgi:hypothetical protein